MMTDERKARLPLGKRAILLGLVFALVLAGLIIWQLLGREREYELTAFAMGSYVQQTVWGREPEPEAAAAEAVQGIEELEREISWRRDGGVAHVNSQAGGEPVALSDSVGELLAEMMELCERSSGALDVTLGPVTRLWDFDNEPKLPDEKELKEAMALVGYTRLSMDSLV